MVQVDGFRVDVDPQEHRHGCLGVPHSEFFT